MERAQENRLGYSQAVEQPPANQFPTTRWSLIQASETSQEDKKAALDELLVSYWAPLYCFMRAKGNTSETAAELVQGFCLHMLERDFLQTLTPDKGRLRSFFRTAMSNYAKNVHKSESASKRGGAFVHRSIDTGELEEKLGDMPAEANIVFDQQWARAVMTVSMERLKEEFQTGGRTGPFELVSLYFGSEDPPPYREAAERFSMTIPQIKSLLHRARARFGILVREEVSQTLSAEDDVEAELSVLMECLS